METFLAILNRASHAWLEWMSPMAWQAALMGIAILVAALLAWKASPRFRYFLWCLMLLKLCLPPSVAFVTGVGQWVLPKQAAAVSLPVSHSTVAAAPASERIAAPVLLASRPESAPSVSVPQAAMPATITLTRAASHVSWITALAVVWCLGAAAMVLLFLIQHRRVRRLLAAGEPVSDEGVLRLLEEAKTALGVFTRVTLVSVEKLHSPILFGVLHPRIAIPRRALESLPADQIRPILLHELAHLRRKDLWVGCVQLLVQVFYWFHPVVWLTNRQLRRERELIVDDIVLAQLQGQRENYSASLLNIVKQGAQRRHIMPAYLGIVETPGSLNRRLQRILDVKRKMSLRLGWVELAALVALGFVLIPQARSQERKSETPQVTAPRAEAKPNLAEPFRIRGVVLRQDDQPVEGVRLFLYHNNGGRFVSADSIVQEAVTGKDGTFEFANTARFEEVRTHYLRDSYVLVACHPDYAITGAAIEQEGPGKLRESYRLSMTAAQVRSVTVTDLFNGVPLPGARVRVAEFWLQGGVATAGYLLEPSAKIAELTALTDAGGQATFKNLPATHCLFVASHAGYADNYYLPIEAAGISRNPEPRVIRLVPGACISGRLATEDGKPVSDATVDVRPFYGPGGATPVQGSLSTKTDVQGRFEFNDVAPGPAELILLGGQSLRDITTTPVGIYRPIHVSLPPDKASAKVVVDLAVAAPALPPEAPRWHYPNGDSPEPEHWEITRPGVYEFELGKDSKLGDTKIFHFKFAQPTQFTAQLEHQGSNAVTLLFRGGEFHNTKDLAPSTKPGASPSPFGLSAEITMDDVRSLHMDGNYLELRVSTWDKDATARCKLTIKYDDETD